MKSNRKREYRKKSKDIKSMDIKKLTQLEQQQSRQVQQQYKQQQSLQQPTPKQPQHYKNNILLIIVVILIFIAVLFVLNLTATQREKATLQQQEQQNAYIPYEELVEQKQSVVPVAEEKQTEQQLQSEKLVAADVPDAQQENEKPKVISEEQLIEQQKAQKAAQQSSDLESQLSTEYTQFFLGNCKDSDGGKNFYEQGTAVSKTGSAELDLCSTAKQYPNRLYEFYCDKNEMARKMFFECPNGCKDGACV